MSRLSLSLTAATFAVLLAAPAHAEDVTGSDGTVLNMTKVETFESPWAMTFLPSGQALVSEKEGGIWLLNKSGKKSGKITNVPKVKARGQGGMGDIIAHPEFAKNKTVFLSYVERDPDNNKRSGAVVESATLALAGRGGQLVNRKRIWEQTPKVTGNGHYGHRLAVSPDGKLFISSGDRQKFTPSQNMDMNLGKILRINQDGSLPEDNPFYKNGGVSAEIWSLGHRNPLGLDFDASGQLWETEMGPRDGDELNLIVRSENYGYPVVSNGKHYSGKEIPDHDEMPIYEAPKAYWVPAISPGSLEIYNGKMFADWQNDALIGGLSSSAIIRVDLDAEGGPSEAARYEWGERVREVEEGPDGAIYALEDNGSLMRFTPKP